VTLNLDFKVTGLS